MAQPDLSKEGGRHYQNSSDWTTHCQRLVFYIRRVVNGYSKLLSLRERIRTASKALGIRPLLAEAAQLRTCAAPSMFAFATAPRSRQQLSQAIKEKDILEKGGFANRKTFGVHVAWSNIKGHGVCCESCMHVHYNHL